MNDQRVEYLDRLRSHWYQSHSDWLTYKNLFDTNQERIELINATVPRFFVQIQGTLLNSAILGVSKNHAQCRQSGDVQALMAVGADVDVTQFTEARQIFGKSKDPMRAKYGTVTHFQYVLIPHCQHTPHCDK